MKILHLQTISELTGIPLVERGTQEPKNLGNYIHLMGEHCKVLNGVVLPLKHYIGMCMHALCRWLNHNNLGVSHASSFNNQVLHITYILMTKEKDFCMCCTPLDTISSTKDERKTFLPLPILVTQICKE